MKRIVAKLVSPKQFDFFEEELPPLNDNEVLYKTISVGLCHSEMPAYLGKSALGLSPRGYHAMVSNLEYPLVIGHEPVCVVEDVGKNVTRFKKGDYVTGRVSSSFASYLQGDFDRMVRIPKTEKPIDTCLGEPMFCVANIIQAAAPIFGDKIAVVGCGFMGLMTLAGLASPTLGDLVAIDLDDSRLELAKKYGATRTINPKNHDVEALSYEITNGKMFDTVVEITGSLKGLDLALSIIRISGRGKILISSVYSREEQLNLRMGYNLMCRSPILHSTHPWYNTNYVETLKMAIDAYVSGVFPVEEMVTHRIPLYNIGEGFALLERPTSDFVKGIVTFEGM